MIDKNSDLYKRMLSQGINLDNMLPFVLPGHQFEVDIENSVVTEYGVEESTRLCKLPAMKVHNKKGELDRAIEKNLKVDEGRNFSRLNFRVRCRGVLDLRFIFPARIFQACDHARYELLMNV